jgi:hypothetical protein
MTIIINDQAMTDVWQKTSKALQILEIKSKVFVLVRTSSQEFSSKAM